MDVRQRTRSLRLAWAPSPARRLMRHRLTRVGVLAAAALIIGAVVHSQAAAVERAERRWGETRIAFVVAEPVAGGELVRGAAERRELPLAMLPAGAVDAVSADQRALVALFPGDVVIAERLTGADVGSQRSDVSALTVGVVTQPPQLAVGDLVDLWQVVGEDMTSERVVRNVTVLAFVDGEVTVGVPASQLPEATAASLRPLILTITGS